MIGYRFKCKNLFIFQPSFHHLEGPIFIFLFTWWWYNTYISLTMDAKTTFQSIILQSGAYSTTEPCDIECQRKYIEISMSQLCVYEKPQWNWISKMGRNRSTKIELVKNEHCSHAVRISWKNIKRISPWYRFAVSQFSKSAELIIMCGKPKIPSVLTSSVRPYLIKNCY